MANNPWEETDTTTNEESTVTGAPWETNTTVEEEGTVIQGTPWETSGTSSIGEVIDSVVEANPEVVEQIVSDIPDYTTAYDLSYNPMDEYMVEAEPQERDPSFMENVREGLIAPVGGLGSAIVNSIETLDWAVGWTDKASALQNITGDFLTYNPEDLDPDVRVAYENADGFHIYDGTGTKVKYITGAGLEKLKEANIVRLAGLAEQVDKAIVTNEDLQAWGYQDSLTGKISGTMSQFLALFLPSSYVTAPLKFGKYTDDVVKGTITGFTAFPSDQERASAMLKEMGLENDFINWLADNEDDSMFEGKFKNAVEEATFGAATGEVIRLTGTLWRGLKVVKAKQDAKSAKESVEKVNEALKKVEEEAGKVIENPADPSTIRLIDPETGEVIKMADEADSSIAKPLKGQILYKGEIYEDTRGQGVQYHGARSEINQLDEGSYSSANIYGQGLYTTDAKADIAKGYQRESETGVTYRVDEIKDVKLFDADQKITPENIKEVLGSIEDYNVYSDDVALGLIKAEDDIPFNNMGETFDIVEEVMEEGGTWLDVFDKMRTELDESSDIIQEMFLTMNEALARQVFYGLTYVGGAKTGS